MSETPRISHAAFDALVAAELPFAVAMGFRLEGLGVGTARCRALCRADSIRPGGTIAGPILMGLADFALYAAVLSRIGAVPLAVTTSLTTNFLRRPRPADVLAEARLLKLGRRLAYGEVMLLSEGEGDPVAHVTGTYSIPPEGGR
ncbi:MAG: PaaI family thioesterase [Alphaproteobacteria bacterium]|nr:PaaI family thioesterase [Alphaproteobacteria bacterium]